MAYATLNDLKARYDVRVIAKYASDTGTPVSVPSLSTNPRIKAALQDASGQIASALVKGGRYRASVLTTLAADETKGALLRQMTCALAMAALMGKPVGGLDEIEELVFGYKTAMENLDALRNGATIFDLDDAIEATQAHTSDGPKYTDPNRPTNWNPIFGSFANRRQGY